MANTPEEQKRREREQEKNMPGQQRQPGTNQPGRQERDPSKKGPSSY